MQNTPRSREVPVLVFLIALQQVFPSTAIPKLNAMLLCLFTGAVLTVELVLVVGTADVPMIGLRSRTLSSDHFSDWDTP